VIASRTRRRRSTRTERNPTEVSPGLLVGRDRGARSARWNLSRHLGNTQLPDPMVPQSLPCLACSGVAPPRQLLTGPVGYMGRGAEGETGRVGQHAKPTGAGCSRAERPAAAYKGAVGVRIDQASDGDLSTTTFRTAYTGLAGAGLFDSPKCKRLCSRMERYSTGIVAMAMARTISGIMMMNGVMVVKQ